MPTAGQQRDNRIRAAWWVELQRLILAGLAGWFFGWLSGAPHLGLAAGFFTIVLLHLRMLYLLVQWTIRPQQVELPDSDGIWGQVFDELYALQRRNRKRKKKLASILAEFQASTAALPDGAVVVSPVGNIAWFNNAAQALLGLRAPQDIGNRIHNLMRHPQFTRYVEAGDFDRDIELPSPVNPQFTLNLRMIPYGDGQRLLIVRDVSEHARLDMMRRDFVANASHELRTPLTVLSGYIEMMQPEAEAPEAPLAAWKAPLREMRSQLGRMELLIKDLLKLARLESDTPAPRQEIVDMPEVIRDCLAQARQLSGGAHRIDADIDDTLKLHGREAELQSIVINLLSNAVRYTPAGGEVRLRWRVESGEVGAQPVISVHDSGIGISENALPRITERFYRVDIGRSRASGGTGLGLAIVKHALEHHEATLEVVSEPGVGSEFRCVFPAYRLSADAVSARSA